MAEKLLSYLFLLVSLTYLLLARGLSFGTLGAPKAGFLPVIIGNIAVILAIAVIFKQLLQKQAGVTNCANWRKCIFLIIGLVLYVIFLDAEGYLVATFIIMFYLLKVTDTAGWTIPCAISAGVAIGFYLVFEKLLGVNLP